MLYANAFTAILNHQEPTQLEDLYIYDGYYTSTVQACSLILVTRHKQFLDHSHVYIAIFHCTLSMLLISVVWLAKNTFSLIFVVLCDWQTLRFPWYLLCDGYHCLFSDIWCVVGKQCLLPHIYCVFVNNVFFLIHSEKIL